MNTADGVAPVWPIEDVLGNLPEVDLVSAFGVPDKNGSQRIATHIQLIKGATLKQKHINAALKSLPKSQRPTEVKIVDKIPTTSWYRLRPLK